MVFDIRDPGVDEDPVKRRLAGQPPEAVARALAEAKALQVSDAAPDALVIGSDQVLAHEGAIYDKPRDLEGARTQLLRLRGSEHRLLTAVCVASAGSVSWAHLDEARLVMRLFSEDFLEYYLATVGPVVCRSVGGYQLEGPGVQLFSSVTGDHFGILGLPLLPLLAYLRREGALED